MKRDSLEEWYRDDELEGYTTVLWLALFCISLLVVWFIGTMFVEGLTIGLVLGGAAAVAVFFGGFLAVVFAIKDSDIAASECIIFLAIGLAMIATACMSLRYLFGLIS